MEQRVALRQPANVRFMRKKADIKTGHLDYAIPLDASINCNG